jgi:hypothetical protein
MQENKGIVYIALGSEYVQMACKSIESILVNSSESYDFCIITDIDFGHNLLIKFGQITTLLIEPIDPSNLGASTAYLKTRLIYLSPFDKTLYVDCDIRAVRDIACIWSYCGESIAVASAFNPICANEFYPVDSEQEETQKYLSSLGDFTQYNTGLFLFKKSSQLQYVFDMWLVEWIKYKQHESMAFNRLVAKGMPVNYLLSIYNDFYPNKNIDSVLVHYIGGYKKHLSN